MKFAITGFTVVAVMFIALGANRVLEQQQQLAAARPVPATVDWSDVLVIAPNPALHRRATTYKPVVRYSVRGGGGGGGAIDASTRVFPPARSDVTSESRARRIVADHPKGKSVTAWQIPPAKPFDPPVIFLLREWDFEPYLIILLAMIHLSVGLALWTGRPWQRNAVWPPRPAAEGGNWHELSPRVTLATRRHPWRAVSLAWYAIGGAAVGHYFWHADRPYATGAIVASALYAAAGLVPVVGWLGHRRLARVVRDARVLVNADAFRPGKTFNVRVEQALRRPARVESVRVGLVCERTLGRLTRAQRATAPPRLSETWTDVDADPDADPARPLTARTKLTPPADQPPSTPPTERAYPRIAWRIVVEVRIAGRPAYRAEYPITVVAHS
jgi:hypothetical protein